MVMSLPQFTNVISSNQRLKEHLQKISAFLKELDGTKSLEKKLLGELDRQSSQFFPFPFSRASFEMNEEERSAELQLAVGVLEELFEISTLLLARCGANSLPVHLAAELYVLHMVIPLTDELQSKFAAGYSKYHWCEFPIDRVHATTRLQPELQRLLSTSQDMKEFDDDSEEAKVTKRVCSVLGREFARVGESIANKAPWLITAFLNLFFSQSLQRDWNVTELSLAVAARCLDEFEEVYKLLGVKVFDSILVDSAAHAPNSAVRVADLHSLGYAELIFDSLVRLIPKVNSSFEREHCSTLLRATTDTLLRCILVLETETQPQIILELLLDTAQEKRSVTKVDDRNAITLSNPKAKRCFERAFSELHSNLFYETNVAQTECVATCIERFVDRFGANCVPLSSELLEVAVCGLKTSAKVGSNARLTLSLLRLLVTFARRCSLVARQVYAEKLVTILFEVLMHNEALLRLELEGERFELSPRRDDEQKKKALEQVELCVFECFDYLLRPDDEEAKLAGCNRVNEIVLQLSATKEHDEFLHQYSSIKAIFKRCADMTNTTASS